jgi:hypothetical protein
MMKKVFLVAVVTALISGNIYAKCAHAEGNMIVKKVTLGCLDLEGNANFSSTTIQKALTMKGDLTSTSSTLNNLDVAGKVNLQKTTVIGPAKIAGSLSASQSTFSDKLTVNSALVTLDNSSTHDIDISFNKKDQIAYVTLSADSVVNGNISFANRNGIVKNNHSKINGKVSGGKVVEK